ncbi:MAG: ImpA family type VI secretion system protein [Hyphomicrobiales bacterium]
MTFVETVRNPISGAEPCGPNPEESLDYTNFAAAADARLPGTFREFDKAQLDAEQTLAKMHGYFSQFMDARLLVLAAKYEILSNHIEAFADAVIAAAMLVGERWDYFHPLGNEDGHALRAAVLSGFNDLPTIVLPLQAATLVTDRRLGPISYRVVMLANKQMKPAPDEKPLDLAAARDALLRDNFEATKSIHELFARTAAALKDIRAAFVAKIGAESAPVTDQLEAVVAGIAGFLGQIVGEREPKAAAAGAEPAQAGTGSDDATVTPSGQTLASAAEAAAALRAVEAYYAGAEPSNPALLLVRLAQQLIGRSFVEAMEILSPAIAAKTAIKIAGDWPMTLTFEQLKSLSGKTSETASAPGGSGEAKPVEVLTRQQALAVMADVETYFRRNEPSSPIPFLLEKARRFAGADFHALLRDIMNPGSG